MADIALKVNGKAYAGWKSVRVTRGIEAVCGSFDLAVTDRWADQATPWPIVEEDECVLTVGGVPIITGYVDKRSLSYGPEDHTLRVSGRDRTGMLVDCSAVLKSWEFHNLPVHVLAQRLADPFGIPVTTAPGLVASVSIATGKSTGAVSSSGGTGKRGGLGVPKPPAKFTVDPGESAFEVLDRACRMAGVLPVSDGAGGLLITRTGATRAATALVEGQNILSASADYDAAARYAKYVVSAQHQGTDQWFGASAAGVKGTASDATVRRTARVLYIRPEAGMTREAANVRAAWEAKVRAARCDTVSVTVQGWTQGDGTLWPVNALVQLRSPLLGMNTEMLITQVTYALDEGGEIATLNLKRPDAFLPEPTVTAPGAGGSGVWKEIRNGA